MRTFILGTDWGEDCDDCVAVRILARAHQKGEINLLGIGINTLTDISAPSLYRFLEKEGVMRPIGVDKNCPHQIKYVTYQKRLAAETDKTLAIENKFSCFGSYFTLHWNDLVC